MTPYEIWSLAISIASIVISIVVTVVIYRFGRRIEKRNDKTEIERLAREFIIKFADEEILYLPYCVMANATHRHHKHIREIYNAFDALPSSVQKEILFLAGYDYEPIYDDSWVQESLNEIIEFAEKRDLGDPFLYGGCKHFYDAFDCSKHDVYEFSYEEEFFDDYFDTGSSYIGSNGLFKISFSLYLEFYYRTFILGENEQELAREDVPKPLDYLKEVKQFASCSTIGLAFWMMHSVSELSCLVLRDRHGGYLDDVDKSGFVYRGDAAPQTFEDLYYETLMDLYNQHLDKKKVFK